MNPRGVRKNEGDFEKRQARHTGQILRSEAD